MNKQIVKQEKKIRRKARIRAKIHGTAEVPRLSVFRSNKGIKAQLIDDDKGTTILSVSSHELKARGDKSAMAGEVGKLIAQKAAEKKIGKIVFDKGSYKYHGRIKALAEAAREAGIKF